MSRSVMLLDRGTRRRTHPTGSGPAAVTSRLMAAQRRWNRARGRSAQERHLDGEDRRASSRRDAAEEIAEPKEPGDPFRWTWHQAGRRIDRSALACTPD